MSLDSLHSLRPETTEKCDFSGGITDEQTDRQMDRQMDWRTDRWTDRWTNERMDRPFYRNARTHLKTKKNILPFHGILQSF